MKYLPAIITEGATAKQLSFCEEYIKDKNGTQAAIRAGYSKKTARTQASTLLTKPNIQAVVKHLFEQVSERNKIEVDELVGVLAKQARFDIAELYDADGNLKSIHDIPKDIRMSLEEIQVDELYEGFGEDRIRIGQTKKIKTANRQNAIRMLLQIFGAFKEDNEQKAAEVIIFKLPDNKRQ